MTALDLTPGSRPATYLAEGGRDRVGGDGTPAIGWVTPGPLRQLTGGYLYDARMVDGLRAGNWPVGVLDIQAGGWPLDLAAGRRLVNGIGRQRWGAVIVDELAHPALVAAILTGRLHAALRGAPLVLLVHHLRCSEPAPWLLRTLARLVESVAVRAAALVVCTSETTAQTVRPLARRGVQVAVVRPGWDTHARDLTPPTPLSDAERGETSTFVGSHRLTRQSGEGTTASLPILPPLRVGEGGWGGEVSPAGLTGRASTLRLLLVGHWTPRKGILQALAALRQTRPDVTLDLVGEQDRDLAYAARVQTALLARELAGRVRVHGRVSADTLAQLFAEADALIMPSTHEGYGMVLAEALAAGLPIIATRAGAIPEVVRDGKEATLVPVNDTGALALAIERLAASPEDRQRRARLALERARELPTWTASIAAFEHLLTDLVRRSQGD